ncbi:DNA-binding response regulator [Alishewanella longhuensis]|uniref:DNA-binding response regulator n=1 Tax=Alishewanella longhuensis TaxID=1091037 RepID=A0ABQ3L2J9_9ALTE|nr:LytTR family DNA-binding domain-containing protein [Alishewanella longhuensis]GHG75791.1 DNA-binding response regulator [Alishewanella longhuensis]
MMKLSCLIVDDEPLSRAGIRHLLEQQPQFAIAAETDNGADALKLAKLHQPDIIILDVELPVLDGLTVLKQLNHQSAVILCSGSADYAVHAFDLSAVDYLLKPFSPGRFQQALLKACSRIIDTLVTNKAEPTLQYVDRLTIRDPGRLRLVDVNDIRWIQSAGNYVEIYVYSQAKCYLLRESMTSLQQKLDPALFARVHRSYLVRKQDIAELRPGDKGDAHIMLKCGAVLPVSRRHRDQLAEMFGYPEQ